jgi:hypothetical protein
VRPAGLRSAGLATLAAVVRAAVGGRAGVRACSVDVLLRAQGVSPFCCRCCAQLGLRGTNAPSLRARGERTCPSFPHSLIPDHPKPAVLLLGSAPVQPRAHAIRRHPDCRRVPRLYPSVNAPCRTPVDSPPHCRVVPAPHSGPTNAPTLVFQTSAPLGQCRCTSVSLEPQASSKQQPHDTDRATSNQQPPAASEPEPKPKPSNLKPPSLREPVAPCRLQRGRLRLGLPFGVGVTRRLQRRLHHGDPALVIHSSSPMACYRLLSLYKFLSHCLHFPRVMRAGIGLPRNDATTTWPPQRPCHDATTPPVPLTCLTLTLVLTF